MPYPYPLFQDVYPEIVRLGGVMPDQPAPEPPPPPIAQTRPPGSRRRHTGPTVAEVRRLIEHTALSYEQIRAKTGVCLGTISNWARDGKWVRPLEAPRSSDRMPAYRASRRLQLRMLAGRLEALADRTMRELEQLPGVEVETLMQAMQVLKLARLEAQGGRRRHPLFGVPRTGAWTISRDQAIRTALKEMRRGGADIGRAPAEEPPPPITHPRPPGSRRPHTDMTYAEVRSLIEHTALTYGQIQKKTGVDPGTISCWTRDGKWARPLDAPRASDRLPTVRAGRRLKLRKLASRLQWMAERYVEKLEETPGVDLDLLMQALQVLKMARLEAMGNRHRLALFGPPPTGRECYDREQAIRTALKAMRRGGVDLDRAPQEALDLVLEARAPMDDNPHLRDRKPRSRSNPEHAQLLWPHGRGKWRGPGARRPK